MKVSKKLAKLRNLPEINPDKLWVGKAKYELLSEISAQNRLMKAHQLSTVEKADLLAMHLLNRLSLSFTKVTAGFLIIFMGSGVSLAAQASVPGQALWPVKRSIEKVELTFTISSVKETEIHIKHVNKRLEEIDKILENQASEPEAKVKQEKAIKQAVSHLEKDVTAADASLKVAKAEKNPAEVVALAKKVTQVTKEVAVSLEAKKIATESDLEITKALDGAKEINQEVKASAVSVALEVHQEVVAMPTASSTDISMIIDTSTQALVPAVDSQDIETIKNVVAEIVATEIDEATQANSDAKQAVDNAANDQAVSSSSTSQQAINQLKDENVASESALEEARSLLNDGFLIDAFYKIEEVKDQYQKSEEILKQINSAIRDHKTLDPKVLEEIDNTIKASAIKESSLDLEPSLQVSK